MKKSYVRSRRWRVYLLLCCSLLVFGLTPETFGQVVTQGAAVKANFGIDADVYANRLQYGGLPGPEAGTDDWFENQTLWPGLGMGVIDQTDAAAHKTAAQADKNYSFEERMSVPRNTVINGITWIDAVYFRDNNATQDRTDATVFTSTEDKNGDNPATWNLGDAGTPQKNDLIDVMGHMRMDENGDIWGIGAFTTISADGNSHGDFEFFANQIEYNGSNFTGLGDDAGHTAWTFNPDGSVLEAGDLLVAVDFLNGGTTPSTSVRVWLSDADFASLNSKPNREFDLTGVYDSGTDADGFGYAEIEAKDGANTPAVWAIVNTEGDTPGAPWGSLEGPQATYYDDIKELQFTEFAINMTTLGLTAFGGDACNKTLGSLVVKTRSSQEFTAELKDFAGPFLFGYELETDVEVQDLASCENGENEHEFDLNDAIVDAHGGNISFYLSEADAIAGTNSISATQTVTVAESPKTFWVRSSNTEDENCNSIKSFTVITYDNSICSATAF